MAPTGCSRSAALSTTARSAPASGSASGPPTTRTRQLPSQPDPRLCGSPIHAATSLDAKTCAAAIRGHWGIENRNHHVRDRTLGEDASRIRRQPGVFARLRSFALNILRGHGVGNVSEALYANALSLDRLLAYGLPRSQN